MEIEKELELCIKIDEKVVIELSSKITQESIVETAQNIKQRLIDYELDREKIFNVYDVSIEMLQNILKYSYGNKIDEDKKREADGKFILRYDTVTKEIVLCSCNLIESSQVDIIKQRVDEVTGLNEKELRKLLRVKMKSKRDGHSNGAGLGFATIATKISKPIDIEFKGILKDVVKFKLEVTI